LSYASVPPDFIDQKEKGISDQSEGEIDENSVFHRFPHSHIRRGNYGPLVRRHWRRRQPMMAALLGFGHSVQNEFALVDALLDVFAGFDAADQANKQRPQFVSLRLQSRDGGVKLSTELFGGHVSDRLSHLFLPSVLPHRINSLRASW
jgi:hypothetical protein